MPDSNPFDDLIEEKPPPRRKRRPWWRWNLTTLAVALFALLWIRELTGWSPGQTWMFVLATGAMWFVLPTFFVPTFLTTMPDLNEKSSNDTPDGISVGNRILVGWKVVAVMLAALSLVHFAFICYVMLPAVDSVWLGRGMNGGQAFFFQTAMLSGFAQPLLEFVAALSLYVLAEIALRLDRS